MIEISPSIASADVLHIADELERVRAVGRLHLDIEDGNYSPDITFGLGMVEAVAGCTDAALDTHLMAARPMRFLDGLLKNRVRAVAVHIETVDFPFESLDYLHAHGAKAGLAISMKTPPDAVLPFCESLDYLLVLTNDCDNGAVAFRDYSLQKIARAREILPERVQIWADGGIRKEHIRPLSAAGLDVAVVGRAAFGAADPVAACRQLAEESII